MGINDNGDVVGWYQSPEWAGQNGFIAPRGGAMQNVRSIERNILQINSITNDGQMTGLMETFGTFSGKHAFRTRMDGTLQDLGWGTRTSMGLDINNAGDVVGFEFFGNVFAFKFSDAITECRFIPCGKINLGSFGGANSTALSINNAGVVVGWSERLAERDRLRAFRAKPDISSRRSRHARRRDRRCRSDQ